MPSPQDSNATKTILKMCNVIQNVQKCNKKYSHNTFQCKKQQARNSRQDDVRMSFVLNTPICILYIQIARIIKPSQYFQTLMTSLFSRFNKQ